MKKIFIILTISVLAAACGGQKSETSAPSNTAEPGTLTIDFQAMFGEGVTNNAVVSENAYLKATGSYGDIDGKIDAATGASMPTRTPDLLNKYRAPDNNLLNSKMELGISELLLFATASADRYVSDGVSGNGFAKTSRRGDEPNTQAVINGTGITKGEDGVITIRFAHARYLFEIKTDTNGVLTIGNGNENYRRSENPIDTNSNINFDDAVFVTDKAKDGMPYWKGDLQATYENNILKINGTLTETK